MKGKNIMTKLGKVGGFHPNHFPYLSENMSQYLFVWATNSELWDHLPPAPFMRTCSEGKTKDQSPAPQLSLQIPGIFRRRIFWQPKIFRQNTQDSPYIIGNIGAIRRNTAQCSIVLRRDFPKNPSPSCVFSTLQLNILILLPVVPQV